jgi:hypothetical protein
MNEPFRRDRTFADPLLTQLKAMNTMAEAARKAGYEDGYRAGLLEAKRIFDEAFKTWPGQK